MKEQDHVQERAGTVSDGCESTEKIANVKKASVQERV